MASKQREYQKRMVAAGRCCQCGNKRNLHNTLCDGCAASNRIRVRDNYRKKVGFVIDRRFKNHYDSSVGQKKTSAR